jgi:L-amino acid N-acyltransferase YncA/2-polyprenyl-3-methyl-5-hydroxy-6-metoxy-1,4-benzoquinol methylase
MVPPGDEEIRAAVVARYAGLARAALAGQPIADCSAEAFADGCFGPAGYADFGELPDGAVRASLGCGNPVAVADLRPGQTVLDLGSGGGIDVLLSARRVAPDGMAYGLDATAEMVTLARSNAEQAGVANVEFLHGHIEDIPLADASVDVVISNCVINLSADKPRVLDEAFRVLQPGGRFGISDIVADDGLDRAQRARAEHRVGCPVGTLSRAEYVAALRTAGFATANVTVTQELGDGLHSAIVQAVKPAAPPGVVIRPLRDADAARVLAIYQAGLDTGDASFETSAPSWPAFIGARLPSPRYVAAELATGNIVGWVAATRVSERSVYAGVVEHSIYVDPDAAGRGVGAALLDAFIAAAETDGIWTIQSSIFPENTASLRLHAAAGFRVVGTRERIGERDGRWRDVIFLERRSPDRDGRQGGPAGQGR